MARSYWLVKSEPAKYPWAQLVRDGRTVWDGVRNALARQHLAAMRRGDLVLYYHSNEGKEIVGIARVVRASHPDSTADDPKWLAVDLEPVRSLVEPVGLAAIKSDARFEDLALVRQSRLSVLPVSRAHFDHILKLGMTKAPR